MSGMMSAVLAVLFFVGSLARGQTRAEQDIVALLRSKFPQAEVLSVRKAEMLGLWEAFVDGQIVYVDKRGQYFIAGSIYEVRSMQNLTDERLAQLRTIPFTALPTQLAVTRVQGKGSRRFAIFEDPFCGYCRALEAELNRISDFTAYVFMDPILGDASVRTTAAAWCSSDRLTAWHSSLTSRQPSVAPTNCDAPVDQLLGLGRRLGVTGTPTILFEDGTRHEGILKADELSALLDKAAQKAP